MIAPALLRAAIRGSVLLTGACALTYQVVWQRYLARIAGSDSLATAVVLAVFLGGLSIGYLLCGRWTVRLRRPLRTYGLLEIAIGAWALLFPLVFRGVDAATAGWSFATPGPLVVQGFLVTLVLVGPPTVLMGATVPMLTRGLVRDLGSAAAVHARLYAWNTVGAVVGTLAAGYVLVQAYGLPGTLWRAGVVNLVVGVGWWVLDALDPAERLRNERPTAATIGPPPDAGERRALWALAALSGASFMLFESLFVRVVRLTIGASSYAFALIVAVFVLAIAIGAFVVARRGGGSWNALAGALAISTVGMSVVFWTLDVWPYAAHVLRVGFSGTTLAMGLFHAAVFGLLLLVLLVPVAAMGAVPPILFDRLRADLETVGRASGSLLAWNALGNLVGGLVGGWLLFLWLGIGEVFLVGLALQAVALLFALPRTTRGARRAAVAALLPVALVAVAFPYDPLRFAAGTFRIRAPVEYSDAGPAEFYRRFHESRNVLAYVDDPGGTYAVIENPAPEETLAAHYPELAQALIDQLGESGRTRPRSVFVNGKSDSSTYFDRETLRLAAHVPALLAERPRRAFVVGLGTGVTAGELTLHGGLESIVVAEIAPAVVGFLPLFEEANRAVADDPRVDVRVGDALRLLRRDPTRYDLITSEPSNPWVVGVDQLFSREFYRLVRSRLDDGGVFLQWVQRYATDETIVALVTQTVHAEFPHVYRFRTESGDDLLLASAAPLDGDRFAAAAERIATSPALAASLAQVGIDSVADLRARIDREGLEASLARPIPGLESLDHPRLHYLSGQAFFAGSSLEEERVRFGY